MPRRSAVASSDFLARRHEPDAYPLINHGPGGLSVTRRRAVAVGVSSRRAPGLDRPRLDRVSPGDGEFVYSVGVHVLAERDLFDRYREPQRGNAVAQCRQRDLELGAGQEAADAHVHALAEGEVAARVAVQVEFVGVGEGILV